MKILPPDFSAKHIYIKHKRKKMILITNHLEIVKAETT
jgi:hypothetical protein